MCLGRDNSEDRIVCHPGPERSWETPCLVLEEEKVLTTSDSSYQRFMESVVDSTAFPSLEGWSVEAIWSFNYIVLIY